MVIDTPKHRSEASCPNCWKETRFCLCAEVPVFSTRTRLLILQHPREARNPLGTARLTSLALPNAVHRVGLSWPSLSKAVGTQVDSQRWAVLFLGALKETKQFKEEVPFQILGKGGKSVPFKQIEGVVLLDGNWKQSKTLWWRNPWLLRLHRVILNTASPSQYGTIRRQPRKHCLSTIEAAAESLAALGEDPAVETGLKDLFSRFVNRVQEADARGPARPTPEPDLEP